MADASQKAPAKSRKEPVRMGFEVDLAPTGVVGIVGSGGGARGGSWVGPEHPLFDRVGRTGTGIGLPPGLPTGARFDPVEPPMPGQPGQPRPARPARLEPDPDHMRMPRDEPFE